MPPATKYIADVNSVEARELDEAYQREMRGRQQAFNLATDYYHGMHKKHLLPDGTNTEDNVVVNLVGLTIDKGVSALMGTNDQGAILGPDFEIAEEVERQEQAAKQPALQKMMGRAKSMMADMLGMPQDTGENPAKEYLDSLWEANHKELLLHDLAVNGGTAGHCFMKIDPTHPLVDPDGGSKLIPRLTVLNPANVCKFWDILDVERTLWYTIVVGRWSMGMWEAGSARQDIVRNVNADGSDANGWSIYQFRMVKGKTGWQPDGEVSWDYPWAPIVEWKNLPRPNHPYGSNDLDINVISSTNTTNVIGSDANLSRGLVGLNDSLNFTLSNIQRIIKNHASPITVMTGADPESVTATAIDRMWGVAAPEAKISNLEMNSDLGSSLNFAGITRSAFFASARELDPNTVQDKLGALTNFGIRVLNTDKLAKLGTKRLLYGMALEMVCQYCLELAGFGTGIEVVTKWPDPLPSDPLATAQALMLDRQNGLSQDTYLERRGYDPEVEAQKREREHAEQVQVQQTMQDANTNDQMVNQGMGGGVDNPGSANVVTRMQRQMGQMKNGKRDRIDLGGNQ